MMVDEKDNLNSFIVQLETRWHLLPKTFDRLIYAIFTKHNARFVIDELVGNVFKSCDVKGREMIALKELQRWVEIDESLTALVTVGADAFFAKIKIALLNVLPLTYYLNDDCLNNDVSRYLIKLVSENGMVKNKYCYNRRVAFEFMNRSALIHLDAVIDALSVDDLIQLVAYLFKDEKPVKDFETMLWTVCGINEKLTEIKSLDVAVLCYFYHNVKEIGMTVIKRYGKEDIERVINPMEYLMEEKLLHLPADMSELRTAFDRVKFATKNKAYLQAEYTLDLCIGMLVWVNCVNVSDYLTLRNQFADCSVLMLQNN